MPAPEAAPASPAPAPPVDPRAFRDAIGLFATGVTVVAAQHGDHVHAMTANAVTSLSLRPTLLIVCVSKQANMAAEMVLGSSFSVNVLRAEQQDLSNYFAGQWLEPEPPHFDFDPWQAAPRLQGCAAALACVVESHIEGGDHWIIIGRVLAAYRPPEPPGPLVFYAGKYRRLAPQAAPAPDLSEAVMPLQIFYDPW
jgi:flavin reductase (DIM6/NTAB) family NADH-FMN oxidoreductase RutF